MPVDEDWIVRLRAKLGIVTKSVEKIPPIPQPKPLQPDLPLAATSTGSVAGSEERIAVYRARAEAGKAIFHPCDNREIMVRQSHAARVG